MTEQQIAHQLRVQAQWTAPAEGFAERVMERIDAAPIRIDRGSSAARGVLAAGLTVVAAALAARFLAPPAAPPSALAPIVFDIRLDRIEPMLTAIRRGAEKNAPLARPLEQEARLLWQDAEAAARYLRDQLPLGGVSVQVGSIDLNRTRSPERIQADPSSS